MLETQEIESFSFLEQIADEMYAVLQGKNLKCEVEADDDIVVRADPDKLARVFDELQLL